MEQEVDTCEPDEETGDADAGKWLDLRLGGDSSEVQSEPDPVKVYSCSFCTRKFFSSQALGGHQNAHRRERGAVRRPQHPTSSWLRVHPHSVIHKPGRGGAEIDSAPRFLDPVMNCSPLAAGEDEDLMWARSFQESHSAGQPPELQKIDLSLRL